MSFADYLYQMMTMQWPRGIYSVFIPAINESAFRFITTAFHIFQISGEKRTKCTGIMSRSELSCVVELKDGVE